MNEILASIEHTFNTLIFGAGMADELLLTDGQILNGTLVSRDASKLVFEIDGQELTFACTKVKNITLGS